MTCPNILLGDLPSLKEWNTIKCDQYCQKFEEEANKSESQDSSWSDNDNAKWVRTSTLSAIHKTRPWDKIIIEVTNTPFSVFGTKMLCFEGWDWSPQDFETKSLKAIFVSDSMNTRAYRVYVIDRHKVMESVNMTLHDTKLFRT